jgi:hypothetical protein
MHGRKNIKLQMMLGRQCDNLRADAPRPLPSNSDNIHVHEPHTVTAFQNFRHPLSIAGQSSTGYLYCIKVQQSHCRPGQTLMVPEGWGSQNARHTKGVRLSALDTGHLYPPPPKKGNIPGTHFC